MLPMHGQLMNFCSPPQLWCHVDGAPDMAAVMADALLSLPPDRLPDPRETAAGLIAFGIRPEQLRAAVEARSMRRPGIMC